MKPRKYTLTDNLMSALLGVAIAIPLCIASHKNQVADSHTIESIPVETMTVEPIPIESVSREVKTRVIVQEIPEPIKEPIQEPKIEYISLGEFKITAYCSCSKCCGKWAYNRPNGIVYGASGNELIPNYSIAVDPNVIPYGTKVYFNDNEYVAHDCGGSIKGNRIDLYFNSHDDALEWGVQYYDVQIIKE